MKTTNKYKRVQSYRNKPIVEDMVQVGSKQYNKYLQSRDKYIKLAAEARGCGDRVAEQHYLQFADHYSRQIQSATAMDSAKIDHKEEQIINDPVEAVMIFKNDAPAKSSVDEMEEVREEELVS